MKKLLSFMVAIFMAIPVFAASNCMNYQAVINKADGTPAADTNIGMRFRILNDSGALFEETATVKSDAKGFVKYAIGSNTQDGLYSVDWSFIGIKLEVGIDLNGGTDYTTIYTTDIQSVPTAIFAEESASCIEARRMFADCETSISDLYCICDDLNSKYKELYVRVAESEDHILFLETQIAELNDQIAELKKNK